MSRATSKIRNFAARLIAEEMKMAKSFETQKPTAFQVFDKLRPQLAMLMGEGGFRALMSRALALANTEVPWLKGVRVKTEGHGYLEGLDDLKTQVSAKEVTEGAVVLLAQLLGLLSAFIGEELVLSLARDVWPAVSLDDLDSGDGGKK
jgi:hypothetical protein